MYGGFTHCSLGSADEIRKDAHTVPGCVIGQLDADDLRARRDKVVEADRVVAGRSSFSLKLCGRHNGRVRSAER